MSDFDSWLRSRLSQVPLPTQGVPSPAQPNVFQQATGASPLPNPNQGSVGPIEQLAALFTKMGVPAPQSHAGNPLSMPMGLPGPTPPTPSVQPAPGAERRALSALIAARMPGMAPPPAFGPSIPTAGAPPQAAPPSNPVAFSPAITPGASGDNLSRLHAVGFTPDEAAQIVSANPDDVQAINAAITFRASENQRRATQQAIEQAGSPGIDPVGAAISSPIDAVASAPGEVIHAAGVPEEKVALGMADAAIREVETGGLSSNPLNIGEDAYQAGVGGMQTWSQTHPDVVKDAATNGFVIPGSGTQVVGATPGTIVAGTEKKIKPGKEAVLAAYYYSLGGGVPGFIEKLVFQFSTDPTMLVPFFGTAGKAVGGLGEAIVAGSKAADAARLAESGAVVADTVSAANLAAEAARTADAADAARTALSVGEGTAQQVVEAQRAADAARAAQDTAAQAAAMGPGTASTGAKIVGGALQKTGKGIEAVAELPNVPVDAAKAVIGTGVDVLRLVPWIDHALSASEKAIARTLAESRQAVAQLLAKSDVGQSIFGSTAEHPGIFAGTALDKTAADVAAPSTISPVAPSPAIITGSVAGDAVEKIGDYTVVKDPGGRFVVAGPDGKPASGYVDTVGEARATATHLAAQSPPAGGTTPVPSPGGTTPFPPPPSGVAAAQALHDEIDALMQQVSPPSASQVKSVVDRAKALTTPFPPEIPQPPNAAEFFAQKQQLHQQAQQLGYTPGGVKPPELGYTPPGETHLPPPGEPPVLPKGLEPLTPDDVQAVHAYVQFNYVDPGGEYKNLNIGKAVADPELANTNPAEVERLSKVLDGAISKQVFPQDTTLYRGVSHPELDKVPTEVGDIYVHDRYVSTSHDLAAAKGFGGLAPSSSYNEPRTILQFNVPKGMPGLDMTGGPMPSEAEILLPRKTQWQVTGITDTDGGRYRLVTLDPVHPTGAGITPPGFKVPPPPNVGKGTGVFKDGVEVAIGDPVSSSFGKGTVVGRGYGNGQVHVLVPDHSYPISMHEGEIKLLPAGGTTPFGETSAAPPGPKAAVPANPSFAVGDKVGTPYGDGDGTITWKNSAGDQIKIEFPNGKTDYFSADELSPTGSAPSAPQFAVGDTVKTTYGGDLREAVITEKPGKYGYYKAKLQDGTEVSFQPNEIVGLSQKASATPPPAKLAADIPMSAKGHPLAVGDVVLDYMGENGTVTGLLGDQAFGHKVQVQFDNGALKTQYADELTHHEPTAAGSQEAFPESLIDTEYVNNLVAGHDSMGGPTSKGAGGLVPPPQPVGSPFGQFDAQAGGAIPAEPVGVPTGQSRFALDDAMGRLQSDHSGPYGEGVHQGYGGDFGNDANAVEIEAMKALARGNEEDAAMLYGASRGIGQAIDEGKLIAPESPTPLSGPNFDEAMGAVLSRGKSSAPPVGQAPPEPPATVPGPPAAAAPTGAPVPFPDQLAYFNPDANPDRIIGRVKALGAQGDARVQAFYDEYLPKNAENKAEQAKWKLAEKNAGADAYTSLKNNSTPEQRARWLVDEGTPSESLTPEGKIEWQRRQHLAESYRTRASVVRDYVDQVEAWKNAGLPGEPPPFRGDWGTEVDPRLVVERDAKGKITNVKDIRGAWQKAPTERPDVRNLFEQAVTNPDDQIASDIRYSLRSSKYGNYRRLADDAKTLRERLYGAESTASTADRLSAEEAIKEGPALPKPAQDAPNEAPVAWDWEKNAPSAEPTPTPVATKGATGAKDQKGQAQPPLGGVTQDLTDPFGGVKTEDWFAPQPGVGGLRVAGETRLEREARLGNITGHDDHRIFGLPEKPSTKGFDPDKQFFWMKQDEAGKVRVNDAFKDDPVAKAAFDQPLLAKGDDRYFGDIFLDNLETEARAGGTRAEITERALNATLKEVEPAASVARRSLLKRVLYPVYQGYLWLGRRGRDITQFSLFNAPKRLLSEYIGNTWNLMMHGKGEALGMVHDLGHDATARSVLRDVRENTAEGLATGPVGRIDEALGLAPKADVTVAERFGKEGLDRGAGPNQRPESRFWRMAKTATGFSGSKLAKGGVATIETTFRAALHASELLKNVAEPRAAFFDQVRALAAKKGGDAERLISGLNDLFSPADVRRLGKDAGFATGDLEHLARSWRSAITEADGAAGREVDRLFFSYKTTNLDEAINKVFFYHYWASRAAPLYLEAALRNPAVMATYAHLGNVMQQDCERRNGERCKYLKVFTTEAGLSGYVSPLLAISTTLINFEPDFHNPNARMIDKVLHYVPAQLAPIVQMGLSATGLSSQELLDPIASYGPRRFWTSAINVGKAQGWWGDKSQFVDPTTGWFNAIVSASSDWFQNSAHFPLSKRVPLADRNRTAAGIIQTDIINQVYAEYHIPPGTDPMELAKDTGNPNSVAAITAIDDAIDARMQGKPNKYADKAFQNWVSGDWKRTAIGMAVPGSTLGSDILDAARHVAGDPTLQGTSAQKAAFGTLDTATAGSPESLALQTQGAQRSVLGTPAGQYAIDVTGDMKNATNPIGRQVGDHYWTGEEIASLPKDANDPTWAPGMMTRTMLADLWAQQGNFSIPLAQTYAARDAFDADPNNPEYARYKAWAANARSLGVDQIRKVSPAYDAYLNGQKADVKNDPAKFEQAAFGYGAFLATDGERKSLSSDLVSDTFDPSKANPVDMLTPGAGNAVTKAAKKSPGQQVIDDLQKYQVAMVVFDKQLQAFTGNPSDRWDPNMNPQLEQAMRWHLANAGITIPSVPRSVTIYENWAAARQALGQPSGILDYDIYATDAQATLDAYGLSIDDLLSLGITSDDFNAKDPFANAPAGFDPKRPYAGTRLDAP